MTTRHKGKKEEDGLGLVGSRETTAQLQYIVPVLDLQLPVDVFNFPGRRQRRRRQLRTRTGAMKGQGREKRKSEGRAEGGGKGWGPPSRPPRGNGQRDVGAGVRRGAVAVAGE